MKSLELDELSTVNFSADVIDGDIIYYNRIEGNEIIVDTRLTLTNTGVVAVGNVLISDIELTYLNGVTSNIQTQLNDLSSNNTSLIPRITALETSDTSQNLLINKLQISDTSQNIQISSLNYAVSGQINSITNLQTSDTAQNTLLSTHTSQISAIQTVNTTQNTLLSTHTSQITALQTADISLNSKTQNIVSADTSGTYINKKVSIIGTGQCLDTLGIYTSVTGSSNSSERVWLIGNEGENRKLFITNDYVEGIYLKCGAKSTSDPSKGWQPLNIFSNGVNLYRGGTETGNTQSYIGSWGPNQSSPTDNNFYIGGNGVNNLLLNSGIGNTILSGSSVSLSSNIVWVGGSVPAANGRYSNINMINSAGSAWETQSSAFTEALKQQVINVNTLIQNAKTPIARWSTNLGNTFFLGRTNFLTVNTNYPSVTNIIKMGPFLNTSGYYDYFNTYGSWIFNSSQRVNFQMDMEFDGLDTGIKVMLSRFLVYNSAGSIILQSNKKGVTYNAGGGNPMHKTLYYSTENFCFDISYGDIISFETENFFSTSSLAASVTTIGRLIFYLS